MCGLAGIWSYRSNSPRVDSAQLLSMREQMTPRGPDGAGLWLSEDHTVGLAHRRLSIIDLTQGGAQPMADPESGNQIVFNGEIYNHAALRTELQKKGHRFRSNSDTEVLLKLYVEYGQGMLSKLRGMFAFAIWNAKQKTMFLARDPYGIKPLYYADDGNTIQFASTVKALLAGGRVNTTPSPAGHTGFFLWGSVPEPWTLYAGIRALPAGHTLTVTERGVPNPVQYESITQVLQAALQNPAKGTKQEALEAIAHALRDSVNAHLIADVPVGMFLSAGLDSALITALATEQGQHPQTLTLSFSEYKDTINDEAPAAQSLAQFWGTRHVTAEIAKAEFETQCADLLKAMDQPSIDGVNTWFVSRAAAQQGMKVALSGVGGDELFASYSNFATIPKLLRFTSPLRKVPGLTATWRELAAKLPRSWVKAKYASLLEYGGNVEQAYFLVRSLNTHWQLPDIMDPAMAKQGWTELEQWRKLKETIPRVPADRLSQKEISAFNRLSVSALESNWYMKNQLLRDTDWAAMAHSLEIRTPLVDIELLRQTAPWLSAHPDISKAEVVATAVARMPRSILQRPKTGFSIPVGDWLLSGQVKPRGQRGLNDWGSYVYQTATALRT